MCLFISVWLNTTELKRGMFTDCKGVDIGGKEPVNTVADSLREFGISHTFFNIGF
jgi:hypothetical protein